jgi:protein-S-isoprenylcysteine O-methyltransferase Ste14
MSGSGIVSLASDGLALRAYLFAGLFLHKLIWEILKRGHRVGKSPGKAGISQKLRLVKCAKIAALGAVVVQTLFLNILPISGRAGALRIVGVAIFTLGLVVAIIGRLQLGKNWLDLEDYQALPGQSVVTHGIYRFIRHPIYAGDVLLLLGLELALNSWLVLGIAFLLLVIGRQARAEETMMSATFPDYEAYRRRTKMFIPYIF